MYQAPEDPPNHLTVISSRLVRGSAWMVAMRWTLRGVGLVSTLILVRLLAPTDFGLVATAMIVVGFLDAILQTGVDLALIRNAEATIQKS